MDKEAILIMLATKLDEYGVDEDEILRNVKMYERYLDSMTPREREHELNNIDVNAIAERIYNIIRNNQRSIKRYEEPTPPPQPPKQNIKVVPSQSRIAKIQPADTIPFEKVEKVPPPINFEVLEAVPIEIEEDEPIKASLVFWLIFILTLPITASILLGFAMIYFAVFIALAAMIAGLVAALVAIVASGSALALISIIYGITQTFSAMPIGLFELGLGLIIGGAAMFIGILIYNFAVRFLPFTIKKFLEFTIYSLQMLKKLFLHLKKESVRR